MEGLQGKTKVLQTESQPIVACFFTKASYTDPRLSLCHRAGQMTLMSLCAHLCTMQGEAEFLNAQGELAKLRLQLDWSRDRDETKIERGRNHVLRNLGHMKSKENKLSRIGKEVHGTAVESQNQR